MTDKVIIIQAAESEEVNRQLLRKLEEAGGIIVHDSIIFEKTPEMMNNILKSVYNSNSSSYEEEVDEENEPIDEEDISYLVTRIVRRELAGILRKVLYDIEEEDDDE
jgi:hypothetical protein